MHFSKRLAALLVVLVFAGTAATAEPPDQLFVVISPLIEAGPSGVVLFDVEADGGLAQGATYATGGLGRASTSPQTAVVNPSGRLLFVPNNESDDISVFAIGAGGALSPVAGSPFPAASAPSAMVLHPSGDRLYVTSFPVGIVSVYRVLASGALALLQTVSAGFPTRLEIRPGGDRLYVADLISGVRGFAIATDGTLSELSGSPFTYTSSRPIDVEIDSAGSRLWVLDLDEGIAVFDIASTGELVSTIDPPVFVSDFSSTFVLTPDDANIYATEGSSTALHGFNVRGNGRPRPLNRSPFSGDFAVIELLQPEGTRTLYTVGRETRRVGALAIDANGRLSAPELFDVVDEDRRTPVGAAFFDDPLPSGGIPE
jgi:DNA-binding beta-propeller fold protein YncE